MLNFRENHFHIEIGINIANINRTKKSILVGRLTKFKTTITIKQKVIL